MAADAGRSTATPTAGQVAKYPYGHIARIYPYGLTGRLCGVDAPGVGDEPHRARHITRPSELGAWCAPGCARSACLTPGGGGTGGSRPWIHPQVAPAKVGGVLTIAISGSGCGIAKGIKTRSRQTDQRRPRKMICLRVPTVCAALLERSSALTRAAAPRPHRTDRCRPRPPRPRPRLVGGGSRSGPTRRSPWPGPSTATSTPARPTPSEPPRVSRRMRCARGDERTRTRGRRSSRRLL